MDGRDGLKVRVCVRVRACVFVLTKREGETDGEKEMTDSRRARFFVGCFSSSVLVPPTMKEKNVGSRGL